MTGGTWGMFQYLSPCVRARGARAWWVTDKGAPPAPAARGPARHSWVPNHLPARAPRLARIPARWYAERPVRLPDGPCGSEIASSRARHRAQARLLARRHGYQTGYP